MKIRIIVAFLACSSGLWAQAMGGGIAGAASTGNATAVNGAGVPGSQPCVGTNSSGQIIPAACIGTLPSTSEPIANPGTAGPYSYTQGSPGSLPRTMTSINQQTYSVIDAGAVGSVSVDSTAAFQKTLNNCTASVSCQVLVPCPNGAVYKITNTLVAVGGVSNGMTFQGQISATRGPGGCRIIWAGPVGGTMFLGLGVNNSLLSEVEFDGAGIARNAVWFDSTIDYTSSTSTDIASVSRASNVVTVTLTGTPSLAIASGEMVQISGVTDTSFNVPATRVLYSNSATTFAFLQSGANASSSAGSATRLKSASSSGNKLVNVGLTGFASVNSTISTLSGTTTVTAVTATPHYVFPGDIVFITGASDTTYNQQYSVPIGGVTNSTTVTLTPFGTTPSGAGATGGTLKSDSSGLAIAHAGSVTPQVSEFEGTSLNINSTDVGTTCAHAYNSGNTKNFWFSKSSIAHCPIAFQGFGSGVFSVKDSAMSGMSVRDFSVSAGNTHIDSVEIEDGTGSQLLQGSAGGNYSSASVTNSSWIGATGTSDVLIAYAGVMNLENNIFTNTRTGSSVPKVWGAVQSVSNNVGAIHSSGNWYKNAVAGCAPIYDLSGNQICLNAGFLSNRPIGVWSEGDIGGTAGSLIPLYNYPISGNQIDNITYSATPAIPILKGSIHTITLTGDASPTIDVSGQFVPHVTFHVCQDATGAHAWTWPVSVHGGILIDATHNSTASTCTDQAFQSPDGIKLYAIDAGVGNQ